MFLERNEIISRVKDCEGLKDIKLGTNSISAYDENFDMDFKFNFLDEINFNELFDFLSFEIDKEKFFKILKDNLDPILFLIPKKIYFISNEEELNSLLKSDKYRGQSFDFENGLGKNWTTNSTIIINVNACRETALQLIKINSNFKALLNELIWTTLVHELRHMVCDIGLIVWEDEIASEEGDEDVVELYGINEFYNNIIYEDYIVFK